MSTPGADVITRYIQAYHRDVDDIVALFTDDAIVVDEGQTPCGNPEIKGRQERAASTYQYTTKLLGAERTGEDSYLVSFRPTT